MKRMIAASLIILFCAGLAFAQENIVTGNEWIKVDKKARIQLVTDFMREMKQQGVKISKDAAFYCQKLDKLYAKKPNLLNDPVWKVLKTAMIMERDWSVTGKDPDTIAREWLGDKLYAKWKEKYTAKNPR